MLRVRGTPDRLQPLLGLEPQKLPDQGRLQIRLPLFRRATLRGRIPIRSLSISMRLAQIQRECIHFHPSAFSVFTGFPFLIQSHPIYKWHSDQRRQVARARAASFAGPSTTPHPAFEHIHEPGGFRRNYVKLRAEEQGTEEPQMLNNFIDFLLLFGHFVGSP